MQGHIQPTGHIHYHCTLIYVLESLCELVWPSPTAGNHSDSCDCVRSRTRSPKKSSSSKATGYWVGCPIIGLPFTAHLLSLAQNDTTLIKTVGFDHLLFCRMPGIPLTGVYLLHFLAHQQQQYQSILSPPLLTIPCEFCSSCSNLSHWCNLITIGYQVSIWCQHIDLALLKQINLTSCRIFYSLDILSSLILCP